MKQRIFIYQIITVIAFLTILVLPVFQSITKIFSTQELEGENRAIAQMPKIDMIRLDDFPSQFTSYYNDNFPFRALFFKFDYRIFFKKSPIEQVIIGKNKWLFSGTNEDKMYQGLKPFSEEQIEFAIQNLKARKNKYEEMGIKFYLVIAPTTYEVYPEHLPLYFIRTKKTLTDKFCEHLKNTDIPFIYLKEELLKNKTAGQLYCRLDNHWNELGSYFAYKATVDFIKKDFPQIPVYALADFEMTPQYNKSGNLVNMLNDNFKSIFDEDVSYQVKLKDSIKSWREVEKVGYPCVEGFPYPWVYEVTGETSCKELPNIVIIRDSYFSSLVPFFYNSFSRSVAIFDSWNYKENMDIVLNENPKIVLLFIYEPHISSLFLE
jgi:hypothetical protein